MGEQDLMAKLQVFMFLARWDEKDFCFMSPSRGIIKRDEVGCIAAS